jgi:RHS repeat-associated protein
VASAFDAKNRRVFKSFYDETTLKKATWFFYYDALSRLSEVRYTPDTSVATTYSVFQLFWLGDRLVAYWQTDYPSATTSKRYVGTDESGRPVQMECWAAFDCGTVWTINPDAWGSDKVLWGGSFYQPILFAGQYQDKETVAPQNNGTSPHRPGVVLNGFRTYDPWTGSYLQVDPLVDGTWSPYIYVNSDPVGKRDPAGLATNLQWSDGFTGFDTECKWSQGPWGVEGTSACFLAVDDKPRLPGFCRAEKDPQACTWVWSQQPVPQGCCENPDFYCSLCTDCRDACSAEINMNLCPNYPNETGCAPFWLRRLLYIFCLQRPAKGLGGPSCYHTCDCNGDGNWIPIVASPTSRIDASGDLIHQ